MQIPTMKVLRKADGAECGINKTDFDPALHTEVGAETRPAKKPAKKRAAKKRAN